MHFRKDRSFMFRNKNACPAIPVSQASHSIFEPIVRSMESCFRFKFQFCFRRQHNQCRNIYKIQWSAASQLCCPLLCDPDQRYKNARSIYILVGVGCIKEFTSKIEAGVGEDVNLLILQLCYPVSARDIEFETRSHTNDIFCKDFYGHVGNMCRSGKLVRQPTESGVSTYLI